jgi:hypothetical protein
MTRVRLARGARFLGCCLLTLAISVPSAAASATPTLDLAPAAFVRAFPRPAAEGNPWFRQEDPGATAKRGDDSTPHADSTAWHTERARAIAAQAAAAAARAAAEAKAIAAAKARAKARAKAAAQTIATASIHRPAQRSAAGVFHVYVRARLTVTGNGSLARAQAAINAGGQVAVDYRDPGVLDISAHTHADATALRLSPGNRVIFSGAVTGTYRVTGAIWVSPGTSSAVLARLGTAVTMQTCGTGNMRIVGLKRVT